MSQAGDVSIVLAKLGAKLTLIFLQFLSKPTNTTEEFIERHEARQACKRKATELINEKPSKIACAEALSSHHLDYNAV